jgi:hypothetical protein
VLVPNCNRSSRRRRCRGGTRPGDDALAECFAIAVRLGHPGGVGTVGAFHFRASDNRGKYLFFSWGAKAVEFWTAVRKMTLNDALYAGHRDAVIARLKADAADYIDTLEIK